MEKITDIKNASKLKSYSYWISMHNRCTNGVKLISPQYAGITICTDWYLFSNFNKWFNDNFIESYQLDKDLLIYGNTIYSPDTCLFIPASLNRAITHLRPNRISTVGAYISSKPYSNIIRYAGKKSINESNIIHLYKKIEKIENIINSDIQLSVNIVNACYRLIDTIKSYIENHS